MTRWYTKAMSEPESPHSTGARIRSAPAKPKRARMSVAPPICAAPQPPTLRRAAPAPAPPHHSAIDVHCGRPHTRRLAVLCTEHRGHLRALTLPDAQHPVDTIGTHSGPSDSPDGESAGTPMREAVALGPGRRHTYDIRGDIRGVRPSRRDAAAPTLDSNQPCCVNADTSGSSSR